MRSNVYVPTNTQNWTLGFAIPNTFLRTDATTWPCEHVRHLSNMSIENVCRKQASGFRCLLMRFGCSVCERKYHAFLRSSPVIEKVWKWCCRWLFSRAHRFVGSFSDDCTRLNTLIYHSNTRFGFIVAWFTNLMPFNEPTGERSRTNVNFHNHALSCNCTWHPI